jgi:hypothetical protein
MGMPIWYLISEEAKQKLRVMLPKGWQPPPYSWKPITFHHIWESPEDFEREMRKRPHYRRRLS